MTAHMTALIAWLRIRWEQQRAAGLVEYLLIVSLIAVVALVAVGTFGVTVSDKFDTVASRTK